MNAGTAPIPYRRGDLVGRLTHSFSNNFSAIAIDAGGEEITYSQLEFWIQDIIRQVGPDLPDEGARIVVLSDDPIDYVPTMLAAFRLGALYVPMNPKAPKQRLTQLLAEVNPTVVLCGSMEKEVDILKGYFTRRLPPYTGKFSTPDLLNTDRNNPGEFPAYLFYTSGSTGKPKGIVGKLSSLDHFVEWEIKTFGLDSSCRISQFTTPTFDAYLRDVLTPLSAGGTLCIPPDRATIMGADALWDWIENKGISLIHCVPSLFSALLEGNWKGRELKALKQILLAGEALPLGHAADWISHWSNRIELINLYGSTETTMVKLFHRIQLSDIENKFIPIGKPMPDTEVFVLNDDGGECEPGDVGEIHVATDHRTLGYFNQPEATQNVFIDIGQSRALAYATGDLGTALPDGNFRLFGRRDRQIKVGGARIEPEEIERALLTVPGIQACAVRTLDTPDNTGNLIAKEAVQKATATQAIKIKLVAYLVLGKNLTLTEIRTPLEQLLPTPAIPRSFFAVPCLPLNSNGKTDYHALPSLESATIIRDDEYKEPETSTEKMVADVWEMILQTSGVGRDDNFFSLGGDSLKAMQVVNRIRKRLSANLRITDLLKRPGLKDFCRHADRCLQTEADPSISEWIDLSEDPSRAFPLTPAQKGLWFLWKMDPESPYYTCQGIIHLRGTFDAKALKRAWQVLLQRHDILRVRLGNVSGNPVQRFVEENEEWDLPEDLSHLKLEDAIQNIRELASKDAQSAFNLEKDPLLRSRLFA